ncbi:MAG: outer membrane lipoprotein carrier protein LolA [Gemmatimonadales bacterium]|jgi:outer membrane lipoprotein-sorting protein
MMIHATRVLFVALATTFGADFQTDERAEDVLAKASEAYQAVTTVRSEFVQRIEIRALERVKEGRGTVFQKKPNYFLMKFEDPAGDLLVADGDYFWMYYPSAQPDQVVRTAINRTSEGATLGGEFLVSPKERYVATYVGREQIDGRSAHLLSLVPRFDAPYTLVRVWVDASDYLVRKFEIYEENETIRTITLHDVQAGIDLPDDLFRFSPPPGVEVFTR